MVGGNASHEESMNGQVKIGREFFAKIKNDYADWRWALIREFLQNSFDAPGCDTVTIKVSRDGDNTKLVVTNNGESMSDDILFNKLLTLGGSGKNFEGENTGGFGVAKSLLYYTHVSYHIHTGLTEVKGTGAEYTVTKSDRTKDEFDGTKSTIIIEGDQVEQLNEQVEQFAAMAQWKGSLTLNGKSLTCDLKKGARRRDLGWAVVYSNHSFANTCIVRINGQPMFTMFTRFKGCIVVELVGKAKDTLTSNRDGLLHKYHSELSDLLTAVAVDKRSALREQKAAYKRYEGERLKNEAKKPKKAEQTLGDLVDVAELLAMVPVGKRSSTVDVPLTAKEQSARGIMIKTESAEDVPDVRLGHEFIVKNTTGMVTPNYYTPGDEFSNYSKNLLRAWVACLLKLYQIHDISGDFSVGFVFDEENIAEHETGIYGKVYYINPARVVCQKDKPQCRSFKARYAGAWSSRFDIIASAAHEFVHGAFGLAEHDEDYSSKLTEVMGKVLEHGSEFTPLFRS